MTEKWAFAWLFASIVSLAVLWLLRGSGWSMVARGIVAASFFPAPLFIALGSRSSFVYAVDFLWPFALPIVAREWSRVTRRTKYVAFGFLLGCGVLPFIGGAVAWGSSEPLLQNGINLYRQLAFSCLFLMATVLPRIHSRESMLVLSTTSVFAVVLLVAVALQLVGVADSNVFHIEVAAELPGSLVEARLDERVAVVGLFRGAMGIVFTLAFVSGVVALSVRSQPGRALAVCGAVAAVIGSIVIASKTTLVAMALVAVLYPVLLRSRRAFGAVALAAGVVGILIPWARMESVEAVVVPVLAVLGTSTEGVSTFTGRSGIWEEAAQTLSADPGRLFGIATGGQLSPAIGVYHNEFLAVLMTGGLLSIALYLLALVLLGQRLLGRIREADPVRVGAALAFCAMLVQGMLVAHVQPNLFFAPALMPLALLYGLAVERGNGQGASE